MLHHYFEIHHANVNNGQPLIIITKFVCYNINLVQLMEVNIFINFQIHITLPKKLKSGEKWKWPSIKAEHKRSISFELNCFCTLQRKTG